MFTGQRVQEHFRWSEGKDRKVHLDCSEAKSQRWGLPLPPGVGTLERNHQESE